MQIFMLNDEHWMNISNIVYCFCCNSVVGGRSRCLPPADIRCGQPLNFGYWLVESGEMLDLGLDEVVERRSLKDNAFSTGDSDLHDRAGARSQRPPTEYALKHYTEFSQRSEICDESSRIPKAEGQMKTCIARSSTNQFTINPSPQP